ncbi:Type III restriction enzyme, res subunit [Maioricimonas rarisocia]|uniref:Type III restriction enzyme, res subunit n=1 Tax=Maioricimonas rarisocia TaxID=2528026 RepID=A0A517Z9T8_9PLAN|nr:DEAD/DEAH box helicase family protein [Maioricimonas rarisocia]QDU39200.1 Type III restriction enzyme, res subunit [Maioricimonas rarisocia]
MTHTLSKKYHLGTGDLIVNSPFEEPTVHWEYIRKAMLFDPKPGRRPAGYTVATPDSTGFDDPGVFVPLDLVEQIRPRVKAWREAHYPGVTGITRRLLEHWYDAEQREGRRFFFCQLEAIETLIWLTEADPAETQGIEIPGDGGPFSRWCTKLATGTGKTVVMSMLIAWQVLNKTTYRQDARFSRDVLIIAPGLTVRDRLQVLVPDAPGNYYDEFGIVPTGLFGKLREGRVRIDNWHNLSIETPEQLAKVRSVDKRRKMPRSDEAYIRDVLGEMANARNLLVINDEAHHAWRVPAESKVRGVKKDELDEATKWVGGLDRIHKARGILRCFDFSATPFAPSGKKSSEETVFGWIVSDFGLNDAIESGLVKTPRVVVRDDGKVDKELRSKFYHLYRDPDVQSDLNQKADPTVPLPDLVTTGYALLGADWDVARKNWEAENHPVPPVMITVANRTETAARIKNAFDTKRIEVPELCKPDATLHIDSKVLGQAEAQEQAVEIGNGSPGDDEDDGPVKKLTKQQQAELLRRTVDTVGQVGQPGEQIRNVISVGMLSEGWDAKTVTHIMGLRAFSSQLLCEQVVGRGLRRTSYETYLTEDGREFFPPEHVNIFGVPFTFLPHEDETGTPPPPPPPKTRVYALPEREADFGLSWPNVIRIDHVYRPVLSLDVDKVKPLVLRASDTPTMAELAAIIAGKPNLDSMSKIDLEELVRKNRIQTIIFKVARDTFDQMKPGWTGNADVLIAQLINLTEQFIEEGPIRFKPETYGKDPLRRRAMLMLNMNRVVQHFWSQIRQENSTSLQPVFDTEHPVRSTSEMRAWYTSRPCHQTGKSHINVGVYDSTWEATEAFVLDDSDDVDAWVKNDHLGFEIWWLDRGARRRYRPDFLVRLKNGTMLVLEVKGQDTEEAKAKRQALEDWVAAVNSHGGFGRWACDVSFEQGDMADIIAKYAASES